jgi:hypothetical protein
MRLLHKQYFLYKACSLMQHKKVTVMIQIIYFAQLIRGVFCNQNLRQQIEKGLVIEFGLLPYRNMGVRVNKNFGI